MLENYLIVADILHQQLSFCFTNPNSSQHETTMCNNLPAKLLHHVCNIEKSIASAGYQMTEYGGRVEPRAHRAAEGGERACNFL